MSVTSQPVSQPVTDQPVPYPPSSTAPSSRRSVRSGPLAYGLLGLGVVLVGLGVALPWLTVYNDLTSLPGFRIGGGPLAGLALASAGLVLVSLRRGGGLVLRPVAALGSVFALAGAIYVARGVIDYVADPGPAGPLLMPHAGFGAYVMAAGSASVLAAALLGRSAARSLPGVMWLQLGIAALTFTAGWIHLLLASEHLEEHPLLGAGFITAGLAQVALAALVVARPTLGTLPLLIVLNVAIMAVYAYAVLVGLPFTGDDGGMAGMDMHENRGLVLGPGEPVDLVGAITFVAELLAIGLVVDLARRVARRPHTAA